MTHNELKNATSKQLREARDSMLKIEYLLALEKLTKPEKREAALNLSNVQFAYLKLRRTKLMDIKEKLNQHNELLKSGIKTLQKALKNISDVKKVIAAVSGLLSAVSQVI